MFSFLRKQNNSRRLFCRVIPIAIFLMSLCSCATIPSIVQNPNKNSQTEEAFHQEETIGDIDGYIHISGRAKEGYKEARQDAIEQLLLYLGALEIRSRNVIESFIVSSNFENSKGISTVKAREEASMITATESLAILPPIGKIELGRDKTYYYANIYFSKNDRDRIITMIDITRAFPIEIKNDESMSTSYFRKVIALNTMLTSSHAATLANILESEFLVSTLIRDNTVYVYPRDRYENRVIRFLEQYFGKVEKNGNEIILREPIIAPIERKDAFDLRSIRINGNVSIPEFNSIIRQNGLGIANTTTQERFLCTINFSEFEKAYGTSVNVKIEVTDKKENIVLLSRTLISPNYSCNSEQIMCSMKDELIEFMQITLPALLINY